MFSSEARRHAGDRAFLINANDLHNLRAKLGLFLGRAHKDDMTSVAVEVRRHPDKYFGYSFHPCTCDRPDDRCKCSKVDDPANDFTLGVMTPGQQEIFLKHGHKGVGVDGTHNTSRYVHALELNQCPKMGIAGTS